MKKEDLMERAKKQTQDSSWLIDKLANRDLSDLTEEERYSCYITP